ncbi:hypothetical protein Tco_0054205 [Tanacetum coccineum]
MVTRDSFATLMGVFIIDFGQRKFEKSIYDASPWKNIKIGFLRILKGCIGELMIMFNQGDTAGLWDTQQDLILSAGNYTFPQGKHYFMNKYWNLIFHSLGKQITLIQEVLSQMLELKLETEERKL